MDLNGDGNKDLLTGCFEGGLYWMPGQADGEFSAALAIKDKDDNVLRVSQYWSDEDREWKNSENDLGISGQAVDFDDDGDLDLLMGSHEGHIFLRTNEGTATKPVYSTESIQLMSGTGDSSRELFTGDGHALPIAFDWNNDGLFDIVTGSNHSGILLAKNVGTKGQPAFAPFATLIEPGLKDGDDVEVGIRLQVAAGDFDNDGINDLLVGDYNSTRPKDTRTKEEIALLSELTNTVIALNKEKNELELVLKSKDEKVDKDSIQKRLDKLNAEWDEAATVLQDLPRGPTAERHGYVWLFRGKE